MNDDEESRRLARQDRRDRSYGFTYDERMKILKMLEDHERSRWVWASIGVAAKWISSVGAATAVIIATMKWGFGEIAKWRP